MNRQIKYNTANEKSLQRLTDRYNDSQCTLAHLTDTLKERVRHHRVLTSKTGVVSMGEVSEECSETGVGMVNSTPEPGEEEVDMVGSRHEHRTLEETLALIDRLHKNGQLQDCVIEERRAIAELLTSKSEENLAENLQFYIQNTVSLRIKISMIIFI